jgi:DNA-binding response OmpR family regulator
MGSGVVCRRTDVKKRVLIVEDDLNLSAIVRENLLFVGFEVDSVSDGALAVAQASAFRPDLIVLDIMLPGANGFELCVALRRQGRIPILMVSARGQQADKVRGLNLGADDYITKPFGLDEFLARVNAILRRSLPSTDDLVLGVVRIDFVSRTATRGTRELHLTHREFCLLKYLAERPGKVVSRDELLRNVWEYPDPGITRAVDHAINRVRGKIEPDPQQSQFIHTAVGVGYLLTPEGRLAPPFPVLDSPEEADH